MPFDIGQTERDARAVARWQEYVSPGGGLRLRCRIRPRDEAVVEALNAQYPPPERITRAGRVTEARSRAAARAWSVGYCVAHVEAWDVTMDGAPAPITDETMGYLTDAMRAWIVEQTLADDLRETECPGPFPV